MKTANGIFLSPAPTFGVVKQDHQSIETYSVGCC